MGEIRSKHVQLVLVLHTAVDYLYGQGAGIGIVQRAECATTGITKNHLLPSEERKYGVTRGKLGVENIKTAGRAQMLALLHALCLARATVKRGYPKTTQLQKVTVFSDSPKIVQSINHHAKYAPDSLQDVKSTNDRSLIQKVIAGIRRLSRRGLEVAISVSSDKDNAAKRARTMARQRGRKACKSRRRLRPTGNESVEEQEEAVGDQGTFELVIRAKEFPEERGHKHQEVTEYDERCISN